MRVPTTSKIEAPTGEDFEPAIDGFQSLTKEMDNYERKAQATSDRNKILSSSIDFLTDSLAKYRNRLILATGALAGFTAVTGTMALGINESISELERFAEAKGLNADATLEWIRQEEKIPGLSTQLKAALSNSYLRDYASSIGLLDEQIETMVSYWEINQSRIGKSKEAFITDIVSGNVEQYKSLLKMPPWAVTRQWHQASIDVRKQLGYYDEAEINKRARTLAALQLMGLSTEQAASKKALEDAKPQWDDFLATLSDIRNILGQALLPALMLFANTVKTLGQAFISIPLLPQLTGAAIVLLTIVAGLGAILAIIGSIIGKWGLLVTGFGLAKSIVGAILSSTTLLKVATLAWAAAQWVVNGAMAVFAALSMATGIPEIVIAITAIVALVLALAYHFGIIDKIAKGIDVGKWWGEGLEWVNDQLNNIIERLLSIPGANLVFGAEFKNQVSLKKQKKHLIRCCLS